MPNRFQISPLAQKRLRELNLTADEVIRKALEIKAEGLSTSEGVFFPEGTVFAAWYKDEMHIGRVKEGSIVMDKGGKTANSVSAAAANVTGRPTTNGWSFWNIKLPGKNEFVPIMSFREKTADK
jgi:hypothetical protein